MRVSFNPAVSYTQMVRKQRPYQSQVSFQSAKPKKIFSPEIFSMEAELKKVWNDKEKYNEVLKKYAHIDINSRNFDGDTIFSKALRENSSFFGSIINMEKRGEIEGIDWNFTDSNGDNLLMMAFKHDNDLGFYDNFRRAIDLANEGKIDVNYVNEKSGYSLPEMVLSKKRSRLYNLFDLKNLDITKRARNSKFLRILNAAITESILPNDFLKLVCHPSLDINDYDIQQLINYINSAPVRRNYGQNTRAALDSYQKEKYIEAIATALKVSASRKTEKYYNENGTLTLDQIVKHVENTDDEIAINRPLNETGETIAHFLAETYVDPNDKSSVEKVKKLITKMRSANCYFWKEDSLGRSPLMLALESKNFVVAKAMMEKMRESEFQYKSLQNLPRSAIQDCTMNHIPVYWNLIADLDPKERKEFGTLFLERIKTRW